MPTPFVNKMAKKHKISVDKSEKLWDRAKAAAEKQDQANNFALITTIYKKMLGESFTEYLTLTE
jgi:hypothetical protein